MRNIRGDNMRLSISNIGRASEYDEEMKICLSVTFNGNCNEDMVMVWIERLSAAINYIEENITKELDFAEIAQATHCSSYHFQRMFVNLTTITLGDYIRRRKMSLAAADLKKEGMRVIDVAVKYGYNSPTAFNRAFQRVHGIAPSLVRRKDVLLKSYPPLNCRINY